MRKKRETIAWIAQAIRSNFDDVTIGEWTPEKVRWVVNTRL